MKRNYRILFAFVISVIVFSCNSSGTSDDKKTSVDTATNPKSKDSGSAASAENQVALIQNCEYYITEADGLAMKNNFSKIYPSRANTPTDKLTTEFWIDSCALSSLIDFFNTNGAVCDGARFCFINDKKSGLVIVPTTKSNTPNKKHDDRPDLKIECKCGDSVYFNTLDYKTKMKMFGQKFRKESTYGDQASAKLDSLSASVWFSRCTILRFSNLVTNNSNKLNGIMAICAAHLKMEVNADALGQNYHNQSSLIFVPTYGSSHILNWGIVLPPPSVNKSYAGITGAFNHGELCPKICD